MAAAKALGPITRHATTAGAAARASAARRAVPPVCASLRATISGGIEPRGWGAVEARLDAIASLFFGGGDPATAGLVMQQPGILDTIDGIAGAQC